MRRQDLTQLYMKAHKHLSCQDLAAIDCFHFKLVFRGCRPPIIGVGHSIATRATQAAAVTRESLFVLCTSLCKRS